MKWVAPATPIALSEATKSNDCIELTYARVRRPTASGRKLSLLAQRELDYLQHNVVRIWHDFGIKSDLE